MRPIGRFAHLMSSTVQIAPLTGRDGFGMPTYGTDVPYSAHIVRNNIIEDGAITMTMDIFLNTNVSIEPTSRLTLSTADAGSTESYERTPQITGVPRYHDQVGAHHTKIHAGWLKRSPG